MNSSRYWTGLLVVGAAAVAPFAHAGDVSVGVTITGEVVPGVYGRVDLTNRPAPPPVVYAQPVVIERSPGIDQAAPIYLHVPPGHAKNWRKHCHEYHACNQRVYFVKSREYDPDYKPEKAHGHHEHEDHGRHDDHDRYNDHDHDRGDHGHHDDHDHHDHDD